MSNIVLGVTGSIAAYKSADLVSRLKKAGHQVKVILTKSGSEFITAQTLETLSKNRVVCDMFDRNFEHEVGHISLAKWADLFVIAPATANFIAKYAVGIADDMLTTTVLATGAKVVIAPAMNTAMYEHITTRTNIETLKSRGVLFIEADEGLLACGDTGKGRMAEPQAICEYLCGLLKASDDYSGKTVLVTAGATIEDIDPVRYITNRSTGKMGVSIANAAKSRGARVILIAGEKVSVPILSGIEVIRIRSCEQMANAVKEQVCNADIVISAAAPADFTPENVSDKKIKKSDNNGMSISLKPTVDILKSISDKGKRIHIGFAAETNDIESNAQKKLVSKNLDAIAANDVSGSSSGFGLGNNSITLYKKDGSTANSGSMSKELLADWLLDQILKLYGNNQG